MPTPPCADTGDVRIRLRTVLAATLALAACAVAGSVALGARPRVAHTRAHHSSTCTRAPKRSGRHHTRKASYRSTHHGHHVAGCVKRHVKQHSRHRRRTLSHRVSRRHTRSRPHRPAGKAGGCADTDLEPTIWNVERVRAAVLCLIDRERAAQGEATLQPNTRIQQAAQSHTESMAFGDYFGHVGPGGDTPADRMRSSGYIYTSQLGYEVGENLAWGTGELSTPRAVVAAWMASPGHRANILDGRFRDTAVGVSPHLPSSMGDGQAGGIYTQDFGVIIAG